MASQTAHYRITGTQPLIMHNGQLANPLNLHAKAMKKVTSKKKKVDADHEELAKIEFLGSLYTNKDGVPVLPWYVLEASIIAGAKRSKDGQRAKSGMRVAGDVPLKYDGPKTGKGLLDDPTNRFVFQQLVRTQMSRVVRTRPRFEEWSAEIEVKYDDEQIERTEVDRWVEAAGLYVGVGDWRPRFGTFATEKL